MRFLFRIKVIVPLLLLAVFGAIIWWSLGEEDAEYTTFTVRRGPLDIKVLEGGNVEALENQEVKSQVKGWQGVKILSIVDEGTYITEQDVEDKKVLVELDSSELKEKLTTSEIAFKGTQASLTEALKGYDIQINQSESDIYAAELESKFANLEMEKYLGEEVTKLAVKAIYIAEASVEVFVSNEIIDSAEPLPELPKPAVGSFDLDADEAEMNSSTEELESGDVLVEEPVVEEEPPEVVIEDLRLSHPDISFSKYADEKMLGNGAANQELSKLKSEMKLTEEDLEKAKTDRDGKKRLAEKDFITPQELRTAEIAVQKQEAKLDSSGKALQIFINYEFPKQAEKLMSDFIQARRKLERTEQQALSQIAQANAKLASARARYQIESQRITEYQEQIAACVMVAERPGLVVYGGEGNRYWNAEPIKEGATIRERQAIITIPDMSSMAVKVNIHESDIKKISVGLPVRVRVDAFANKKLLGEVTKVAVLPNAENRWMNPDLKVYETTIKIEGTHDWLKPGMSAETEVLIKSLDDAIYIPLQSVVPQGKKLVCYVLEKGVPTTRIIETGEITVEYVTVTSGLSEGEEVLIRPPDGSRKDESEEDEEEDEFGLKNTDSQEGEDASVESDEVSDSDTESTETVVPEGSDSEGDAGEIESTTTESTKNTTTLPADKEV